MTFIREGLFIIVGRCHRCQQLAGYISLELVTIGHCKAFSGLCPEWKFEEVRSQFQKKNETNETQDSLCLISENKTPPCLIFSLFIAYICLKYQHQFKVITTISESLPVLIGGPQEPVPLLT